MCYRYVVGREGNENDGEGGGGQDGTMASIFLLFRSCYLSLSLVMLWVGVVAERYDFPEDEWRDGLSLRRNADEDRCRLLIGLGWREDGLVGGLVRRVSEGDVDDERDPAMAAE